MNKIYLFYDKAADKLHSWTNDKKIANKFIEQRGQYFNLKKMKYETEEELDNILGYFEGPNMCLQNIPLNSTLNDNINVLGTMNEEEQLLCIADEIDNSMQSLYKDLSKVGLKKKYMKSIEYICSISYYKENDDGTKGLYSKINLLSVFMNHFII